ncbi:MAG: cyclic 2,3-diphosphoglycerate synthase [bacterium]
MKRKVIIMGAAGRDFHNFNMEYRNNPDAVVVAFTATQIPNIAGRTYPPELAGNPYPNGIPIVEEAELANLIKKHGVTEVVFSYSDVSHEYLMHRASLCVSLGATFVLLGADRTFLKSTKPVVAVTAVRTGSGKSPTTRKIARLLKSWGMRPVVIRHPMPYGDLALQKVQRFETFDDLVREDVTIEEREEFESHIEAGILVYCGVDYELILRAAENEADVILWDGGNNDTPFIKPDLWIVLADPHRPGQEIASYPGEVNFRRADVIIINKCDSAAKDAIESIADNARIYNPNAVVIRAASPISVDHPELVKDQTALVIEDGPTLTHGGMTFGAAYIAAKQCGAKDIVEPRQYAVGSLKKVFDDYRHLKYILPAMGYTDPQIDEMDAIIEKCPCDVVVIGTPMNLGAMLKINKPTVRVTYALQELQGEVTIESLLRSRLPALAVPR